MSQILGTLLDSGGSPVTGKLIISLSGTMVEDSTTPDTVYLTEPRTFTITTGVVNIELEESETKKITYNFKFYKTDTEGELIEPALLNFNAIVPNTSPIQFASLVPTGIVNDALDTGALRVARIIASNPNLAANIGGPFPKGDWSISTTYSYRDLVNYLNRVYISKSLTPIVGILPTNSTYWMNIPVEPNGSLVLGDATPYGVSWNGSGLATSQDAVYDVIQTINSDISTKANLNSPIFTGDVIVPNQTAGNNSTRAANTSYVDTGLALKANIDSPSLTGTPTAPTPATSDSTTKIATTAFVKAQLASPTLTGDPKAPTPSVSDNDTSIATTAFVKNSVAFFQFNPSDFNVTGNNVTVSPVTFTCALGSNSYRYALIKVGFNTSGAGKSLALLTASIVNPSPTTLVVRRAGINNVSYLDNSHVALAIGSTATFTGDYSFTLRIQINASTSTDVYTLNSVTGTITFFA